MIDLIAHLYISLGVASVWHFVGALMTAFCEPHFGDKRFIGAGRITGLIGSS